MLTKDRIFGQMLKYEEKKCHQRFQDVGFVMQGEGLLALTQHAVSLSNENPNADHGPHLDGDLALVLGQVRGQEPVTRQRAGHVERSRRAVGQRPRQSHGEGTRHRRVPWEAGEQGVDDWRSSGSEVATNHKGPPPNKFNPCPGTKCLHKTFIRESAAASPCRHVEKWKDQIRACVQSR